MKLRQRQPRQRNERHLAWIRTLPCCVCGDDISTEAAHIRTGSINHDKPPTGMGEKPGDFWVLQLCSKCHREQHAAGDELKWWASKGLDPFMLAIQMRQP